MSITENVQSKLDQRKFRAGLFVELKKTFYTFHHEILLKELSHYGITGTGNGLFYSYVTK